MPDSTSLGFGYVSGPNIYESGEMRVLTPFELQTQHPWVWQDAKPNLSLGSVTRQTQPLLSLATRQVQMLMSLILDPTPLSLATRQTQTLMSLAKCQD